MQKKKIALITGASSGLGREFVKLIDRNTEIDEIWLSSRRTDRLAEIAGELKHPYYMIDGDVTNKDWLIRLQEQLKQQNIEIHTLINSAGIGKTGNFEEIGIQDNAYMVELNILALTNICSICLPYLMSGGYILNIASVAAFLPQAHFAVYAASKAYVLSLSRALNQELKDRKITVTAVCPNPMETEFFLHSGKREHAQAIKNIGLEEPEIVAKKALQKAFRKKDLSHSNFTSRFVHLSSRIFPHSFIFKIEKLIGL